MDGPRRRVAASPRTLLTWTFRRDRRLRYLAGKHKEHHRYDEAQQSLAKLLDYGGPEKLEAQAMLREIRALAESEEAGGMMTGDA